MYTQTRPENVSHSISCFHQKPQSGQSNIELYDFHTAENMDGFAEFDHKNRLNYKMKNIVDRISKNQGFRYYYKTYAQRLSILSQHLG